MYILCTVFRGIIWKELGTSFLISPVFQYLFPSLSVLKLVGINTLYREGGAGGLIEKK